MKKIINKTLLAMLALLPFMAACQSDPDVGTPLYPVEEEDLSPKIYVYSGQTEGNITQSTIVNTPVGLVVPGDTLRFNVHLTRPVDQDVVISIAFDAEKAAEFDESGEVLASDALTLLTGEVTIPAGSTVSSEEVVVAINDESATVERFEKYGVVAMVLSTSSNISIAKDYNTYYWKLYKETLNVYAETNEGDVIDGLTEITSSDWTLQLATTSYGSELTDGVLSSGNYGMVSMASGSVTYVFDSPRAVKAWACVPPQSGWYYGYGVGELKVETSDDGTTWESHGTVLLPLITSNGLWAVAYFYAPVTAKYFRYSPKSRANGTTSGYVYIGEMKLYE